MNLKDINGILESAGVIFSAGLTNEEMRSTELKYNFIFPPDLREFLSYALPISKGWVDWRNGDEKVIQDRLNWPYEGICFDIEHCNFWMVHWGEKPTTLEDCFAVAKKNIDLAPKLIPICSHRYIPDSPNLVGNPIFSVYQTDIIYYGSNLENYFASEFSYYFKTSEYIIPEPIRKIELWSIFVDENN